ncbi:unnamed protein product [Echinostoma caproni]|uniref:C-SKI_SMAD_bind domain-containing protein n=1 Tax=Echinostoma caproni TaxID=27848 RepID=A0A183AZ40_9TREM|nr:unnamed protein product [Echinostoma caproni]
MNRTQVKGESILTDQSPILFKKDRRRYPSSGSTAVRPLPNSEGYENHLGLNDIIYHVMVRGESLVCLEIGGIQRLCLAQISSTLLKNFSYNEIHNRRVALGITCVQCSPAQLELLREAGAMPTSSRRCGTITRREAERLVKSFLDEPEHPKLPDGFAFDVMHHCGWGCQGQFVPSRYNSSRAKCVRCNFCQIFFSPNKFVFHSHSPQSTGTIPNTEYRHPDAANFNAWRRHLFLSEINPSVDLVYAWEDVKAMFNGGNRKRGTNPSVRSSSQTSSDERPSSTCGSISDEYNLLSNKRTYLPPDGVFDRVSLHGNASDRPVYHTETLVDIGSGENSGKYRTVNGEQSTAVPDSTFSIHRMLTHSTAKVSLDHWSNRTNYCPSDSQLHLEPTELFGFQLSNTTGTLTKDWCGQLSPTVQLNKPNRKEIDRGGISTVPFSHSLISTRPPPPPPVPVPVEPGTGSACFAGTIRTGSDESVHQVECYHDLRITNVKSSVTNQSSTPVCQLPLLTDKFDCTSKPVVHPWSTLFAQRFWHTACASLSLSSSHWFHFLDEWKTKVQYANVKQSEPVGLVENGSPEPDQT